MDDVLEVDCATKNIRTRALTTEEQAQRATYATAEAARQQREQDQAQQRATDEATMRKYLSNALANPTVMAVIRRLLQE